MAGVRWIWRTKTTWKPHRSKGGVSRWAWSEGSRTEGLVAERRGQPTPGQRTSMIPGPGRRETSRSAAP